jgi:DNA repair photolyase
MVKFIKKQFKSIIQKRKYIDHWFWERYAINPYNGCQFGCIYCDARSDHYHMPSDFENEILIKQNVAEMLDVRISRARTFLPDVVGIGGVTDPYQPAEKKFENTRQILQVLARHEYPVHIITKSTLVNRDAGLLQIIAAQTWANVSFTVTTVDTQLAAFIDKHAPPPHKRLQTLTTLKKEAPQVQSGVLLLPLIPFLADSAEQLEALVVATKAAGADYLLFGGGMTLRNKQAKWFLSHLRARYPQLLSRYAELYEFNPEAEEYDGRYGPASAYLQEKHSQLLELCARYDLPIRIPRFLPSDFRRINYEIAQRMLDAANRQQLQGRPAKNLLWAGLHIQNLSESLTAIAMRDELHTIPNVRGPILRRLRRILSELKTS